MSNRQNSEYFNRPPRIQQPPLPEMEITIDKPPDEPDQTARSLLLSLLPMTGIFVMAGFYLFISMNSGRSAIFAIPMLAMAVVSMLSALLTYASQKEQQRKQQVKIKQKYFRKLYRRIARLQAAQDIQRHLDLINYPDNNNTLMLLHNLDEIVWNRRKGDDDFSTLRIGTGDMPFTRLKVSGPDPDDEAPDLRYAMDMVFRYRTVPNTALRLNLLQTGSVGIVGRVREDVLAMTYGLVTQAAVLHAPLDMSIYVFSTRAGYTAWNWTFWLPHTSQNNEGGFPDFIAYDPEKTAELFGHITQRFNQDSEGGGDNRAIMVLVDNPILNNDPVLRNITEYGAEKGIFSIILASERREVPSGCGAIVEIQNAGQVVAEMVGVEGERMQGRIETLARVQADHAARQLSQLLTLSGAGRIPRSIPFLGMYREYNGSKFMADIIAKYEANRKTPFRDLGLQVMIKPDETVERGGTKKFEPAKFEALRDNEHKLNLYVLEKWSRLPRKGVLPFGAPIGNTGPRDQLVLNLSEDEHGPHGMVAGTTGSGKSELLRSLVAALAIENHPYYLNFLLIDFKGGATFHPFRNMPHTVGMLSNIDGEDPSQAKIEALRVLAAIKSENQRRQRLFKEADVKDIGDYHKQLPRSGDMPTSWQPIPHLLIIIDEFAELATELPSFLPELVSTVRVGRSLGMHLILAMQRPGNHVKEEIRANLNFRIALRVQSAEDSRDVIDRPEAATLRGRGDGYFRSGQEGLRRFQSAYISANYQSEIKESDDDEAFDIRYYQDGSPKNLFQKVDTDEEQGIKDVEQVADILTQMYTKHVKGQTMRSILQPSLPARVAVQHIIHGTAHQELPYHLPQRYSGGWTGNQWKDVRKVAAANDPEDTEMSTKNRQRDYLSAPIGLIDDLGRQAITPLMAEFTSKKGTMWISGSPGSGKTTLVKTLVMSFAHLYRPNELAMYILNMSVSDLSELRGLPHMGAVINADERERIDRLMDYIEEEIARRTATAKFSGALDDALAGNLELRKEFPPILVIIDNFGGLTQLYGDQIETLNVRMMKILNSGPQNGIHLVITANQLRDLNSRLQNLLVHNRIALDLAEDSEYLLFVGKPDERGIIKREGSGFVKGKPPAVIQIASPVGMDAKFLDSPANDYNRQMASNLAAMVTQMQNASPKVAKPIGQLKDRYTFDYFIAQATRTMLPKDTRYFEYLSFPVGVSGRNLQPMQMQLNEQYRHYFVNGPSRTGKSNIMKMIVLGIMSRYAAHEVQLVIIDVNSDMAAFRHLPHVMGYANEMKDAKLLIKGVAYELEQRNKDREAKRQLQNEQLSQLGDDTAYDNLMDGDTGQVHNKYQSPPIVIVIDDYDKLISNSEFGIADSERIKRLGRYMSQTDFLDFHFIISAMDDNRVSEMRNDPIYREIGYYGTGIALVSGEAVRNLGGRVPNALSRGDGPRLPDGRGFMIQRKELEDVQFLLLESDNESVRDYATSLAKQLRQEAKERGDEPNQWSISLNTILDDEDNIKENNMATTSQSTADTSGEPQDIPSGILDIGVSMDDLIGDYLKQKK